MILLTYLGVSSNDITADICDIIQSETKKKEILHLYPDKKTPIWQEYFTTKKKSEINIAILLDRFMLKVGFA